MDAHATFWNEAKLMPEKELKPGMIVEAQQGSSVTSESIDGNLGRAFGYVIGRCNDIYVARREIGEVHIDLTFNSSGMPSERIAPVPSLNWTCNGPLIVIGELADVTDFISRRSNYGKGYAHHYTKDALFISQPERIKIREQLLERAVNVKPEDYYVYAKETGNTPLKDISVNIGKVYR